MFLRWILLRCLAFGILESSGGENRAPLSGPLPHQYPSGFPSQYDQTTSFSLVPSSAVGQSMDFSSIILLDLVESTSSGPLQQRSADQGYGIWYMVFPSLLLGWTT